jgi:hypothetical protein
MYNKRPSEIMNIDDDYTAYCFDEACAFITTEIERGEIPTYPEDKEKDKPKEYTCPSEMYRAIENGEW